MFWPSSKSKDFQQNKNKKGNILNFKENWIIFSYLSRHRPSRPFSCRTVVIDLISGNTFDSNSGGGSLSPCLLLQSDPNTVSWRGRGWRACSIVRVLLFFISRRKRRKKEIIPMQALFFEIYWNRNSWWCWQCKSEQTCLVEIERLRLMGLTMIIPIEKQSTDNNCGINSFVFDIS